MIRQLLRLCLFSMTSAVLLLISCSNEKSADEYLSNARKYHEAGKLRAALIETRNAVSQAPENQHARFLLGQLELQLANPVDAEVELLKAIELGMTNSEAAEDLSHAYFLLDKLDELEAIDASPLEDDEKATVKGYQTEAALIRGEFTEARKLGSDALKASPISAVALTANARLQMLEINSPAARTYLSTALDASPEHSAAWELLGDLETREQNLTEALTAYTRAVESASNMLPPLLKRARINLSLNDLIATNADIAILDKNRIKTPVLNLLKGEVLLRQGNFLEAQLSLEEGLSIAPDYQPLIRTMAVTHLLLDSIGQAEQYAKQYFSATSSDDSRVLLAITRLQASRFEQAEQTLLPLAESGRLNTLGSQALATILLKQNKIDEAVNTMLGLHETHEQAGVAQPPTLVLQTSPADFMKSGLTGGSIVNPTDLDPKPYLSKRDLLLVDAVAALVDDNIVSALKNAHALLELQPGTADIQTLLARIHIAADDPVSASAALEKAVALNDSAGTVALLEAKIELSAGNPVSATKKLEDAIGRVNGATRERLLLSLATVDATMGNEESMLERLKQARSENPHSYAPSLTLANYYASKSEPNNVLESLSEVNLTGLQNPEAIELRSQAHIALEQFEDAITLITPMIQVKPDSANWLYLRAKANAGMNRFEDVKRDLEVALRVDPDHIPSLHAQTNMKILANDASKADLLLSHLRKLAPDNTQIDELSRRIEAVRDGKVHAQTAQSNNERPNDTNKIISMVQTLWANGEQDEAIATMSEWLDANPEDIAIHLTLANAYLAMNRSAEATAAYRTALQYDANNFIALNNLAWQLRENEPEEAINHAKRAVELQPENTAALDTLAVILLEQGILAEAGEIFEKILALQPTDPTILFHGAQIHAALGNNQDAKDILQPLIEENVDFPDAEAARVIYEQLQTEKM